MVNISLEKVTYLENIIKGYANAIGSATATPMHVQLAIPTVDVQVGDNLDSMQGTGDPWRGAHGHEEFGAKITKWAIDVIETRQWPRTQMIGGVAIDIISIVNAEVQRLRSQQTFQRNNPRDQDDVLSIMQQAMVEIPKSANMQASPASTIIININGAIQDADNEDEIVAQICLGNGGNGGSDDGDEPIIIGNNKYSGGSNNRFHDTKRSECALVNPRNTSINAFSGKHLHSNPYMPFNSALRRLILAQGSDGKILLKILDKIEALGDAKFDNDRLQKIARTYPIIVEFDAAITAALLNWITGVANSQIKYGVCNGLDAWRKFYNRYVPLDDDLQNIVIQELMWIKQVTQAYIDTLFNEIDRIFEL